MPKPQTRDELKERGRNYVLEWYGSLRDMLAEEPFSIRQSTYGKTVEGKKESITNTVGLERVMIYNKDNHTFEPAFPDGMKTDSDARLYDLYMAASEGRLYAYEAGAAKPTRIGTDERIPEGKTSEAPVATTSQPEPRRAPGFLKRMFGWLVRPWGREVAEYDAFAAQDAARSSVDLETERTETHATIERHRTEEAREKAAYSIVIDSKEKLPLEQRIDRLLGPRVTPIPGQLASQPENYPAKDYTPPQGFSNHDAAIIALAGVYDPSIAHQGDGNTLADTVSAFVFENILKTNDPRPFDGEYIPCMLRARENAQKAMNNAVNGDLNLMANTFGAALKTMMNNMTAGVKSCSALGDYGTQIDMLMDTAGRVPGLMDRLKEKDLIPKNLDTAISLGHTMAGIDKRALETKRQLNDALVEGRELSAEQKKEMTVNLLTNSLVTRLLDSEANNGGNSKDSEMTRLQLYHMYASTEGPMKQTYLQIIISESPNNQPDETLLAMTPDELNKRMIEIQNAEAEMSPLRTRLADSAEIENVTRLVSQFPGVEKMANAPTNRLSEIANTPSKGTPLLNDGLRIVTGREAVKALDAYAAENRNAYRSMSVGLVDPANMSVLAADVVTGLARAEQSSGFPGKYCEIARSIAAAGPITYKNRELMKFMDTPAFQQTAEALKASKKGFEKAFETKGEFAVNTFKQCAKAPAKAPEAAREANDGLAK